MTSSNREFGNAGVGMLCGATMEQLLPSVATLAERPISGQSRPAHDDLNSVVIAFRVRTRGHWREVVVAASCPSYVSNPRLLKLAWPLRPITRWSWIAMPNASAAALISRVISMSSRDGLGSPEG